MKRGLLLVTLFLIMKLHFSHSRREETGSRTASSDQTVRLEDLQRTIRRQSEPDPDSFYGMLGKRNSDSGECYRSQEHKICRQYETYNSPWRREYPERRGIFLNKFRLRSLQGL
uniref:Uncharacterized protein n=1 Tax=Xiphophorus maculatus TaxID=8083 RepID=A0A3B5QA10_XIPMA